MPHEFNFVEPGVDPRDLELLMGPMEPDKDGPFIDIQPGWTMAHVMHAAGIFPSVGQARKNGWDRPLPLGFDQFTVGKNRTKIFVLTKVD